MTKKYKKNIVIDNFSYQFTQGNIYLITGVNGCGKTTLIKLISRLIYPNSGAIKSRGKISYSPDKIIFPQDVKLENFLNLLIRDSTKKCYDLWGIDKYKETKLKKLSKGTLVKVKHAITLFSDGDLLLFDEPLNGLDDKSKTIFVDEINSLKKIGKVIIIATHFKNDFNCSNYIEVSL